jgi:murein L,D-transpeptidase YcbB/YkuD
MTGDITSGVDRLMSEIARGQTVRLPIKAPLPLYVEYFTAYPSADGVLQFRRDIYGRDARLIAAMTGAAFAQASGAIGDCVKRG